jgi:dTDP-glucose 4,6-dehydratase
MAKQQRTILVTGAAGFVGHHVVEHLLKNTNDKVIGMDCLTYSGTWDRLRNVDIGDVKAFDHDRFQSMNFDFRQAIEPNLIKELKGVTHVLHMGAESHVDNSIEDPMKFCITNVNGTVNMLNLARELPNLELFVYFSTDEVFGPAEMPMVSKGDMLMFNRGFAEMDKHSPKNPYAASKSAAEQFVDAFANTYQLPCIITRQMNIFGERQHPEKFIPLCIKASIDGGHIEVHGTADKTQAGLRHYIHARNVADAHVFLLDKLKDHVFDTRLVESFHIVGEEEVDNMTLAKLLNEFTCHLGELRGTVCQGATFEIVDFHSSRPGHDLRYALHGGKMKSLGWEPPRTFRDSLREVVKWTLENPEWLSLK